MKKKTKILLIILAAIVVGIFIYWFYPRDACEQKIFERRHHIPVAVEMGGISEVCNLDFIKRGASI